MPRVSEELSQTEIGQIITDKMDEKGMSIKDLSQKLDITYEHVRRIVRGEGVPARYTLRQICEELGIPVKQAEKIATRDKVKKKYGPAYLELTGVKPGMETINRLWDSLTEEQQTDVKTMVEAWVKRNKAVKS
jgi:transcriptional regulator with XRE-family HTH domain